MPVVAFSRRVTALLLTLFAMGITTPLYAAPDGGQTRPSTTDPDQLAQRGNAALKEKRY